MHGNKLFVALFCFVLTVIDAGVVHDGVLRHSACRGVDYPNFGCFDVNPPFTNTRWLPQSPSFVGTEFLLYTRENPSSPDRLESDQSSSLIGSHFNANNPTKILVHGFLQHRRSEFLLNMTRALLGEEAMNVIIVGWSGGAGFPYGQAVANTRLVGAQIAHLVTELSTQSGLSLRQVHIIGHSLGAHVAGYAGARLNRVGRITALDPAQPNYHGFDPEVRLDPTDALLVDVIHTDAQPYDTVHGYGMVEPVGHIDFYPNGGHSQPGCHEDNSIFDVVEDAFANGVTSAENGLSCSHERSTALFTASIGSHRGCALKGFPCDSFESFMRGECTNCGNRPCPTMGLHLGLYTRARGVFFLNTTSNDPFCGHHHLVTLSLGDSMPYARGHLQVKIVGERGQIDWTDVKVGELRAGDELPKILLSHSEIGDVVSVDVKFIENAGFFSWSSDRVVLKRATIQSPIQGRPKHFCIPDLVLRDREATTLTGGSYTQSDCP